MRMSRFYNTAALFALLWGGVLLAGSFALPGFGLYKALVAFIFAYGVWLFAVYTVTLSTAEAPMACRGMPDISPLRGYGALAAGVGAGIMGLCAASFPAVIMTFVGALVFYRVMPQYRGTRPLAQPLAMGCGFGFFAMTFLPAASAVSVSAVAFSVAVLGAAMVGMRLWNRLIDASSQDTALLFNPFPALLALFAIQASVFSLPALIGILSLAWGTAALSHTRPFENNVFRLLESPVADPNSSNRHSRRAA